MDTIAVKLFGKPEIRLNGEVITLSLKRSEALLYYLACEKHASRDALVGLLWGEHSNEVAKKNLRNSLYRIKKDLERELFESPNKTKIELSREINWEIDIDQEGFEFLSVYEGSVLDGFVVKQAGGFDEWRLELERNAGTKFKQLVLKQFETLLVEEWDLAHKAVSVLQKIDPFDEGATRLMMRVYKEKSMYKHIVETYSYLKQLLEEEMGIKPDAETRKLYYDLIQSRAKEMPRAEIFGRENEMAHLGKVISTYQQDGKTNACFIEGEAGVGKTKLLQVAMAHISEDTRVVWSNCYLVEENFAYKSWNDALGKIVEGLKGEDYEMSRASIQVLGKVFPSLIRVDEMPLVENMETIRSDYLEKMVCRLIEEAAKKQKIILVFDDLQWMDEWSLKLLQNVLLHVEGLLVLGTMRKVSMEKLESFIAPLYKYRKAEKYALERFSKEETLVFLKENLQVKQDDKSLQNIYEQTLGNAFFIVEYAGYFIRNDAAALSRLKNLLDARLLEVGKESQKVLDILSMFFDEVEHTLLEKLYSQSSEQLLEVLEELKAKDFILEVRGEPILKWRFTHHMLRNHVYEKTSLSARKILHYKIAEILEKRLTGTQKDVLIFQKLMYHYEESRNISKYLEYTIKYLKTYFDFSHELYPEGQQGFEIQLDFSPEYYFNLIENLLDASEGELKPQVLMQYFHMKARYQIRGGEYEEGLHTLEQLFTIAKANGEEEMLFKAYVQQVYYFIQTEQADQMRLKLDEMMPMVKNTKQEAMLMRLMGIERLLSGAYTKARMLFRASIEAFESLSQTKTYALNIAAAYNYISETYLREEQYEMALEYAGKAIDYCKRYNIIRGRSIFNTNAGIIAYNMNDRYKAKMYLEEALKCYDVVDSPWKKSEAEGYLGIIWMKEGLIEQGRALLESARENAHKMGTPKTIALMDWLSKEADAFMI